MPPVMGAVAFIMASFLDTSYTTIIAAAIVPSTLYYLALILQTDLYAARNGLRGLPDAEIPRLRAVLREGWPHLVSLLALVVLLFSVSPSRAAYYATGLMIALGLLMGHAPRGLDALRGIIVETTENVANLVATLAGIGLVVGALSITGVGNAFSRELIQHAGDDVFLLLVFGALTSFVLGMGMTVSACYVFLAAVLAPALTGLGLDPIAVHLFVLYWGMLSYITPPVALAAITAAQISGAGGLETGLKAMRLGVVLFVLPFMFVYDPGLILRGAPLNIILSVTTAAAATGLLACALEGYAPRLGVLRAADRGLLAVGALLLMTPDRMAEAGGFAALAALAAFRWRALLRRRGRRPAGPLRRDERPFQRPRAGSRLRARRSGARRARCP